MMMKRIFVSGNAGAGKSTLAREIASLLRIPCHSLDRIVWQPGWRKTPSNEKNQLIRELIERDSWVIDGVSLSVRAQADCVIFLDVPRRVSFYRVIKRNWRYLFRSRPELPPRCPEVMIIPTLVRIIWNFPARIRPGILNQCHKDGRSQRFFHIRRSADIINVLAELKNADAEHTGMVDECSTGAPHVAHDLDVGTDPR